MRSNADAQIGSVLEVAERLLVISEKGFVSCDDDGCLLLNGLVRECAYRLRDAAELEREAHGTRVDQHGSRAERTGGRKKTK